MLLISKTPNDLCAALVPLLAGDDPGRDESVQLRETFRNGPWRRWAIGGQSRALQ
jgi:hypothetical protein